MSRILIVDDDPDVVEATSLFLQKEGHETASAWSYDTGLAAVAAFQPDLLVLDIMMEQPDDGIAMAQELRRKGFEKPILMFSSISRVTSMRYGRYPGVVPVDDFIEKPVQPQVLVSSVNRLLAMSGKEA